VGKKASQKLPAFTPLIHNTMDTPAFGSLTPLAQCLYWRLKRRSGYNGDRNGKVFYSVREAAGDFGSHQDTIRAAFYLLQARGFIVPTQIGSLGVAGEGRATTWRLTELGTPHNPRPTKEFAAWSPGHDLPVQKGRSPTNRKQKPALNLRPTCPDSQDDHAGPALFLGAACPGPQGDCGQNDAVPALLARAPKDSTMRGHLSPCVLRTFAVVGGGVVLRSGVRVARGLAA
jgi:hypothetical protein